MKRKYSIWYMKPDYFKTYISGRILPKLSEIQKTHTSLGFVHRKNLEEVFSFMQGENWSPKGEAVPIIYSLGLQHTSMSVGDVVRDTKTDKWYVVATIGFTLLE